MNRLIDTFRGFGRKIPTSGLTNDMRELLD